MHATHAPVQPGLVGGFLHRLFTAPWLDLFRHFEPIFHWVEVEYYICCAGSLFWLSSSKTCDNGYIPSRWASYVIFSVGLAVLSVGLRIAFTNTTSEHLFIALAICGIGTGTAVTARRQLLRDREVLRPLQIAHAAKQSIPLNTPALSSAEPVPSWLSARGTDRLPEQPALDNPAATALPSSVPPASPGVDALRTVTAVKPPLPQLVPTPTPLFAASPIPAEPTVDPPPAPYALDTSSALPQDAPLPPWLQ
jgi:hypothetical protein